MAELVQSGGDRVHANDEGGERSGAARSGSS